MTTQMQLHNKIRTKLQMILTVFRLDHLVTSQLFEDYASAFQNFTCK